MNELILAELIPELHLRRQLKLMGFPQNLWGKRCARARDRAVEICVYE